MAEINGIKCLAGRWDDNGDLVFACDDCDYREVFPRGRLPARPNERHQIGAWTITHRKQRCPDCSDKARAKGWVT